MSDTIKRPYLPAPGVPAVFILAVLLIVTAPPAVFILQGQTSPPWVLTAGFGVLLAAILAVPKLNRRAPAASRGQTILVRVALAAAILVPLALICPAVYPGWEWLIAVGVGVQVALLAAVGIASLRH